MKWYSLYGDGHLALGDRRGTWVLNGFHAGSERRASSCRGEMEPEINQQPEEPHASASRSAEMMARQRTRLRSAVGRIAIRVWNELERFSL